MPTVAELQQELKKAKFRRTILNHLVEYIDSNFMQSGSEKPKKALLTEDRVLVPPEAFDDIADMLNEMIKKAAAEEQETLASNIDLTKAEGA